MQRNWEMDRVILIGWAFVFWTRNTKSDIVPAKPEGGVPPKCEPF